MAEEHIRVLVQARENFVRKRREMAEQMVPEGAAVGHFAPTFTDLQDAIEAIDRAIEDESHLPSSGATAAPDSGASRGAGNITEGANENVVDVDFEP
jgi:hypothetical protein